MKTDLEILRLLTFPFRLRETQYQGEWVFGENHWCAESGNHQEYLVYLAKQLAKQSEHRAIMLDQDPNHFANTDEITWHNRNSEELAAQGSAMALGMIIAEIKSIADAPAKFLDAYRAAQSEGMDDQARRELADEAVWNT